MPLYAVKGSLGCCVLSRAKHPAAAGGAAGTKRGLGSLEPLGEEPGPREV